MADNRKYLQVQTFFLAGAGVNLGDSTMTLQSFKKIDGTNITMSDFGTVGYGTLEPNTRVREESISFTGVVQNSNGTATLTGVKNVDFAYPYTETANFSKSHPGGVRFIITNTAGFYDNFANKNDDETINNVWTYTHDKNPKYDSQPASFADLDLIDKLYGDDTYLMVDGTNQMEADLNFGNHKGINLTDPTNPLDAANKEYVDAQVAAGAPAATTTQPGIVLIATQADFDNGIDTETIGPTTYYNMPTITQIKNGVNALTSTAFEDLTAGDPVGFTNLLADHVAKAAWAVRDQTTSISKTSSGGAVHSILEISPDKFIVAYYSNTNTGNLVCVTLDRATMQFTAGTPTTNIYSNTYRFELVKLDTDKFAFCATQSGAATVKVTVGTVSGTAITLGTETTVFTAAHNVSSVYAIQLATDSIALMTIEASANPLLLGISVSGTTPSLVDDINLSQLNAANAGISMVKIGTNKVACYQRTKVVVATLSGTWTQGTGITLTPSASGTVPLSAGMKSLANDTFYVISDNGGDIGLSYCTVSGTTITEAAFNTSFSSGGANSLAGLTTDGTYIYCYNQPASGTAALYRLSVSGADVIATQLYNISLGLDPNVYGGNFSNMNQVFAENPTSFLGLTSDTPISNQVVFKYHLQGMTDNFIGFARDTVSEGDTLIVETDINDNQSGLIPGMLYIPYQGDLQLTTDNTEPWKVVAENPTTVKIV